MRRGVIKADDRVTVRSMRRAIQGDALRALAELVTNADDSYIRLECKNEPRDGVIEVHYRKQGHSGLFAARDHAEGMSHEDVVAGFEAYGRATSGRQTFRKVRGYFGKGAKDALATMIDGKLYTFRDDQCVECRLFIERGKPTYEIEDPVAADKTLRDNHGIDGDGTVAYFTADPRETGTVPQLSTVHEELSNNYLLRKIMTNPRRRVLLFGPGDTKPRRLRYAMPTGQPILTDDFTISYGEYGDFPIGISICRADRELRQTGDDRDGGLLVVDDDDVVLDISLFTYDNEPLAARFFGEVRIARFGDLLDAEEAVLSEEREGLNSRHPFCQRLIPEIEVRIAQKVKEERLRRQREAEKKIDREEATSP